MKRKHGEEITITKILVIPITTIIFVVAITALSIILNKKVYPTDENNKTSDYAYQKNLTINASSLKAFRDGMSVITDSQYNMGYIDTKGNIVIEPQYIIAMNFSEDLACVIKDVDRGGGYINKSGGLVIDYQFFGCSEFHDGLASVAKGEDDYFGYIDKNGNIAIDYQYKSASDFNNGIAVVTEKDNAISIINKTGKKIAAIDSKYEIHGGFSEGLLLVKDGAYWTYLNESGRPIFEAKQFDNASNFSNGLAAVTTISGKCGYIDKNGGWQITLNGCAYIGDFHNGLAAVQTLSDSSPRVIDKTGATKYILDGYSNIGTYGDTFQLEYSEGLILVTNRNENEKTNYWLLDTDGGKIFGLKQ